ncbi:MAG: uracil-DNA glycosylase family protein [Campylobacterota bacterium]|nr:uracil-DNA glycosylase family protein [Campylobacterota bacterium]
MFHHYHPYKPFINYNTKKIITGTLPPPRFSTKNLKQEDVNFQYGSCDNMLWKVIDKIYELEFLYDNSQEAVKQRKEFLIKHKIGICDIVKSCERDKVDASDIGMENVKLRDILNCLEQYQNIDTIIFTGGYCKNSPEYFLRKTLKEHNIKYKNISTATPKIHMFHFKGRDIKTISLTSPSNAANRSIGANKLYKEKKLKDNSYTTFNFRMEQYKLVFDGNI